MARIAGERDNEPVQRCHLECSTASMHRDPQRFMRARGRMAAGAGRARASALGAIRGAPTRAAWAHARSARSFARDVGRARLRGDVRTARSADAPRASRSRTSAPCCARPAATATLIGARRCGQARERSAAGEYEVPVAFARACSARWSLPYRLRDHQSTKARSRVAWSRSVAFPGLHAGRAAEPPHHAAAAGLAARRATAACSRKSPGGRLRRRSRRAVSPLGERWHGAVVGSVGPDPRRTASGTGSEGRPVAGAGRAQRPRARARRTPAGNAGRRAAGGQTACSPRRRRAPRPRCARRISPHPAADDGRRARRRSYGGVVAMQPLGSDPRGRRHRPRRPAAPGLDLQDGHPLGRAGGTSGEPPHGLPLRHLRDARRRQAEQRQRRGMRRLARNGLRRVVQLGVHAARRQAGRGAAGGDAPNASASTTPQACRGRPRARCRAPSEIHGELDVGSTAIGQGRCSRPRCRWRPWRPRSPTAGDRPQPTFLTDAQPPARSGALSASVAHTVRRLMIGVVRGGTGTVRGDTRA